MSSPVQLDLNRSKQSMGFAVQMGFTVGGTGLEPATSSV